MNKYLKALFELTPYIYGNDEKQNVKNKENLNVLLELIESDIEYRTRILCSNNCWGNEIKQVRTYESVDTGNWKVSNE